jgi:hypothetical protein
MPKPKDSTTLTGTATCDITQGAGGTNVVINFTSGDIAPPEPPPLEPPTDPIGMSLLVPSNKTPGSPSDPLAGATNPHCRARLLRENWLVVDPTMTNPDFSWMGQALQASIDNGKKSGVEYLCGMFSPPKIWDEYGAQRLVLNDGSSTTVPWCPIFQREWRAFNVKLAAFLKPLIHNVRYMKVAYSKTSESFLATKPEEQARAHMLAIEAGYVDDPAIGPAEFVAWQAGGRWAIDLYRELFPATAIFLVTGPPYKGADQLLADMFKYGREEYPGWFGGRADNLRADSPKDTPPEPSWTIISETAQTAIHTGFQAGSNFNSGADTGKPTQLRLGLERGVRCIGTTPEKPHGMIELWEQDFNDKAGPDLAWANLQLAGT